MRDPGIAAYQDASNPTAAVQKYAYLVKRIAQHLLARLPGSVQLDDLIQAGMLGLLEATGKYDATKGASFETYAGIRIRGAMLDEMRRGDWAPRSVHRKSRQVLDTIRRVEHENGRPATDRDVAAAMEISLADYHDIVSDAASCRLYSYEEVNDSDDPAALPRIEPGDHGLEKSALMESVVAAIGLLTEREQLIMSLYYDEELNLKEIGSVLGVSESRISQILSHTVTKIRTHIAEWTDN